MKKCTKCLLTKEIFEFHKDNSRTSGYRERCKRCVSEFMQSPYIKEIRRQAQRKYSKTEKGILTEKKHSPLRHKRASKLRHHWAMGQVRQAKVHGALIKEPCKVCGAVDKIHAHHEDYTKPLEVMWLCPLHHSQRHMELKRGR